MSAQSFSSSFFSTGAQLIGALLIALAVEAGWLGATDTNTRRRIVGITVIYVAIGGTAARPALIPALSRTAYHWLFILTMTGGAGALLSVLAIAYYVAKSEFEQLRYELILPDSPGTSVERPQAQRPEGQP